MQTSLQNLRSKKTRSRHTANGVLYENVGYDILQLSLYLPGFIAIYCPIFCFISCFNFQYLGPLQQLLLLVVTAQYAVETLSLVKVIIAFLYLDCRHHRVSGCQFCVPSELLNLCFFSLFPFLLFVCCGEKNSDVMKHSLHVKEPLIILCY